MLGFLRAQCLLLRVNIIEYGSSAYRASAGHAIFRCDGDDTTILATGAAAGATWLDSIDVATGEVVPGPGIVAMAAEGDLVAVATQARPEIVTLLTRRGLSPVREFDAGAPVTRLAMAGGTVAAVCDDHLRVFTGSAAHRLPLPAAVAALTVSADGELVAVGTDRGSSGHALVIDAGSGTIRHTLTGPRAAVRALALSVRHDLLVAIAGPRVLAWTLSAAKPTIRTLWTARTAPFLVGITDAGRVIAAANASETVSIDPVTATVCWTAASYGPSLVMADRVFSALHHDIREHDPQTGAVRWTWHTTATLDHLSGAAGTVVGSNHSSRPVLLSNGEPLDTDLGTGHAREITAVSFDGARFATISPDRRLHVWQRGSGTPLHTIRTSVRPETQLSHCILLDGDTLYAGIGTVLYRWRLGDTPLQDRRVPLTKRTTFVLSLPDRDQLLVGCRTAGSSPGALYLLDQQTLTVIQQRRSRLVTNTVTAGYRPGDSTARMSWGTGRATIDLDTLRVEVEDGPGPFTGAWHVTPGRSAPAMCHPDLLHFTSTSAEISPHPPLPVPHLRGPVAVGADGRTATVHADGIRVWHNDTAALIETLPLPNPLLDETTTLRWFPDGRALLLAYGSGACYELPTETHRPAAVTR